VDHFPEQNGLLREDTNRKHGRIDCIFRATTWKNVAELSLKARPENRITTNVSKIQDSIKLGHVVHWVQNLDEFTKILGLASSDSFQFQRALIFKIINMKLIGFHDFKPLRDRW